MALKLLCVLIWSTTVVALSQVTPSVLELPTVGSTFSNVEVLDLTANPDLKELKRRLVENEAAAAELLALSADKCFDGGVYDQTKLAAAMTWRDGSNNSRLARAAQGGYTEEVQGLVDFGLELDARGVHNYTPLHSAAEGGHVGAARVLILAGAPLDATDAYGYTPLMKAQQQKHDEVAALLEAAENGDCAECGQDEFCNFAVAPECKSCSDVDDCRGAGLPRAGADECAVACGQGGACFGEDSTVKVQDKATGDVATVRIGTLQVGQKVLAVDHYKRKETFGTVVALPHSPSEKEFIEVAATHKMARGEQETLSLLVTEHHTFPLCDTGFRKKVAAMHLKPGHCLLTENGRKSAVTSVKRVPAKEGGDTYTVVLEGENDLLVVGGLVTHAKPSHPAKKTAATATEKLLKKGSLKENKNLKVQAQSVFKRIEAKGNSE